MAQQGQRHAHPIFLFIYCFLFFASSIFPTQSSSSETEEEAKTASHQTESETSLHECKPRWDCADYENLKQKLLNRSKNYYDYKNCACDDLCFLLQDCCPDVTRTTFLTPNNEVTGLHRNGSSSIKDKDILSNNTKDPNLDDFDLHENGTSIDNASRFVEIYKRYHLTGAMFSCVKDDGLSDVNNVSLVTRCPQLYDDVGVTQLCHNVTDDDKMTQVPVSGRETGVLYRNMFCAVCHQEPFEIWKTRVQCYSDSNCTDWTVQTAFTHNATRCRLHFQPPSGQFQARACLDNVVGTCSAGFPLTSVRHNLTKAKCEREDERLQLVYGPEEIPYRNEYCALCNNVTLDQLFCSPSLRKPVPSEDSTHGYGYSFTMLLDINVHGGSTIVGHREERTYRCADGQVFDPFTDTCRQVVCPPDRVLVNNKCEKMKDDSLQIGATNSSFEHKDGGYHVTVYNCTSATFIALNQSHYRLNMDGSLESLDTKHVYSPSQFFNTSNGLLLCVNSTENATLKNFLGHNKIQAILSMCGLIISLLALAVTILVYSCLRSLRNLPGKNLLSLACSLFIAHSLFLGSFYARKMFYVCSVIGGVMHYFLLTCFLWMNVMAVDVWMTFSKDFVRAWYGGHSGRRFLRYSCYAWCIPGVIVLSAVCVQLYLPESNLNPGYGQHEICWISNKYALLLFFAAPLLLILLINIVLFIVSAAKIVAAKRVSAQSVGRKEKGGLTVCIKLTGVMGLTWVLGFVDNLVPAGHTREIVHYCFIVMNTLQGLVIFLSFVCTRKVFRMLKVKLCGVKVKFKAGSSGSTGTTKSSRKSSSVTSTKTSSLP